MHVGMPVPGQYGSPGVDKQPRLTFKCCWWPERLGHPVWASPCDLRPKWRQGATTGRPQGRACAWL